MGESWAVYLFLEVGQAAAGVLLVFLIYRLALGLYRDQALAGLAAILAASYPPLIEIRILSMLTTVVFLVCPMQDRERSVFSWRQMR